MALWICRSCTAAYAVGLTACPQCGATEYDEEWETMPKISKGDGPTWEPAPGSETDAETAEAQDGVGDAATPGDAPDGEQQTALVSEAGPEVTDLPPGTPVTPADTPPPPPPPGA